MRLARFRTEKAIHTGLVVGAELIDLAQFDRRLPTSVVTLATDCGWRDALKSAVKCAERIPLRSVQLEAPLDSVPMFLGVGLNYHLHAKESGMEVGEFPLIFNKQVSCIAGPDDPIVIPRDAPDCVDYEGELGVVIGKACRRVPADRALDVVAGYVVVNDVSVRDWQLRSPTMTMGKSWDTHGPIGPWLTSPDEVRDPHDLTISTWVDNDLRQNGSTGEMIHNCWELISYISSAFTLLPGTVITTGTPAGVGFKMEPPALLHPGQRVRVEITSLGAIDNPVVLEPEIEGASWW